MLNKIILQGRLTKDIELRYTQNSLAVTTFSIACDRDYVVQETGQRECDFFNITAWKQKAEFAEKWFHKGDMMIVEGRLQTRKYTDRDGINRTAYEVIASNIYFGGAKKDSQGNNQGQAAAQQNGTYNRPTQNTANQNPQNGGWQTAQSNPFDQQNDFIPVPDGIDENLPFM